MLRKEDVQEKDFGMNSEFFKLVFTLNLRLKKKIYTI